MKTEHRSRSFVKREELRSTKNPNSMSVSRQQIADIGRESNKDDVRAQNLAISAWARCSSIVVYRHRPSRQCIEYRSLSAFASERSIRSQRARGAPCTRRQSRIRNTSNANDSTKRKMDCVVRLFRTTPISFILQLSK